MNNLEFKQMLENNPELKEDLFIRAFMITNKKIDDLNGFPFYSNWKEECINNFYFYSHNKTKITTYVKDNVIFFLGGHAYNPFTMKYEEVDILEDLALSYGTGELIEKVNDLTGVFILGYIDNGKVDFLVDPSGMQSAYYGIINNSFYITTHTQILGDMYDLQMDPFAKELINYKYYNRWLGGYLPADLSTFKEVKRIVPGILYSYKNEITHKRFWPLTNQDIVEGEEYNKVIDKAANILKNNIYLISKKWRRPAISLSGGMDSTNAFAAANGLYDKIEAFSYISAKKDEPDVKAAKEIAEKFNIKYTIYNVKNSNDLYEKYYEREELLRHNCGYSYINPSTDIRCRFELKENLPNDVEIKGWASETARSSWHCHFDRTSFPPLSGKLFTHLYKIFIFNRKLANKVTKLYDKFIIDFEFDKIPACYTPADMHFNDNSWGSWGGVNISEMKYYADITIIYANRRFFDLMFKLKVKDKMNDVHYKDIQKILNKELYDMNIKVVDLYHTRNRAHLLNLIFEINMRLPF